MRTIVVLLSTVMSLVAHAAESMVWQGVAPAVTLAATEGGFVRIKTGDDAWVPDFDAFGMPALPQRTLLFAVPDRKSIAEISYAATWEDVAEAVRVVPVAEPVRTGEIPAAPVPVTLAGDATLAAKSGQRLTVSGTVSGTGTLTCSGEVALARSDFTGVVTNGWLDLVGERTNGVFAVLAGGAALAVANLAVNGEALERDEWTNEGGAYTVTPHWRFGIVADADALEKPLKVSRTWLAEYELTPELLAADPTRKGANGYAVWESYLLGLSPTNATAVLKAIVAFENGKLRVSAHGVDSEKTRGVRVRYALESATHPAGPYELHREAQDDEHFADLDDTSTSRFYRVKLQWHWK